jgi:hypothetical protein
MYPKEHPAAASATFDHAGLALAASRLFKPTKHKSLSGGEHKHSLSGGEDARDATGH